MRQGLLGEGTRHRVPVVTEINPDLILSKIGEWSLSPTGGGSYTGGHPSFILEQSSGELFRKSFRKCSPLGKWSERDGRDAR